MFHLLTPRENKEIFDKFTNIERNSAIANSKYYWFKVQKY